MSATCLAYTLLPLKLGPVTTCSSPGRLSSGYTSSPGCAAFRLELPCGASVTRSCRRCKACTGQVVTMACFLLREIHCVTQRAAGAHIDSAGGVRHVSVVGDEGANHLLCQQVPSCTRIQWGLMCCSIATL